MKRIKTLIAIITILYSPNLGLCQTEIGISLGTSVVSNRPSGIDVLSANTGMIYFLQPIGLNPNWQFAPAINIISSRYIMDGLFFKNNDNYSFELTPVNYKQSSMSVTSFRLPLLFRYKLVGDDFKSNNAMISFGPYLEGFVSYKQEYKIGDSSVNEKIPIENKLQYGINSELTLINTSNILNGRLCLTVGLAYQLSEYLNNSSSFKPINTYIKVGITK